MLMVYILGSSLLTCFTQAQNQSPDLLPMLYYPSQQSYCTNFGVIGGCLILIGLDMHGINKYQFMEEAEYDDELQVDGEQVKRVSPDDFQKYLVHLCTGALLIQTVAGGISRGTGFLVSADTVITAAHNVYDKQIIRWIHNSTTSDPHYIPEVSEEGEAIIYFPENYKTCSKKDKSSDDYAFIKLSERVPGQKFLKIGVNFQDLMARLRVCGYPTPPNVANYASDGWYQRVWQFSNAKSQAIWTGQSLSQIQVKQRFVHYISTLPGQSGSPIVLDDNYKQVVIGIQQGGSKGNQQNQNIHNYGRLMTKQFVQKLKLWQQCNQCIPYESEDLDKTEEMRDEQQSNTLSEGIESKTAIMGFMLSLFVGAIIGYFTALKWISVDQLDASDLSLDSTHRQLQGILHRSDIIYQCVEKQVGKQPTDTTSFCSIPEKLCTMQKQIQQIRNDLLKRIQLKFHPATKANLSFEQGLTSFIDKKVQLMAQFMNVASQILLKIDSLWLKSFKQLQNKAKEQRRRQCQKSKISD